MSDPKMVLVPVAMIERMDAETGCDCTPALVNGHDTGCWKFDLLALAAVAASAPNADGGEGKS